jgi:hypothetical protein
MPIITTAITDDAQWHALRAQNVGCSEVGALFGVHDYVTAYGLAARKLGKIDANIDSDVLERGRYLEPVVHKMLAKKYPDWQQIAAGSYYHDDEVRFGATPDLFIKTDRGIGVVQIKTVAPAIYSKKWHNEDTGQIEPPLWIALQAMGEQHLTGANFAVIAALVFGEWDFHLAPIIEVPYLAPVIESARAKIKAFWEMVDRGVLPPPDYEADRDNLVRVLRQDDGTELDLTGDNELPQIAAELAIARDAKHLAEQSIDRCQARILGKIGTAQRVKFAHGIITAKTEHRKEYTVKASIRRPVKVKHDERVSA